MSKKNKPYYLVEIASDVWNVSQGRPAKSEPIHVGTRDECDALKMRFENAVSLHERIMRQIFEDTNGGKI